MREPTLEADYLIVGAGAAGMAFADTLLSETQGSVAIVDRHDRPGGHWNFAYPFVRLHQPAATYGVSSQALGTGAKDVDGLNKGMYELASGQEVLTYFDLVLRRLLASGRVQFVPMSEVHADGSLTSLLSGRRTRVRAGKVVDAAYSQISVPSTHRRSYAVDPEAICVSPNALPGVGAGHDSYVVLGAGKTGIDVVLWLLENGVDPDAVRWVMPRDPWLLNRANFQPGQEFLERAATSLADQVDTLAQAGSVDDAMTRLEQLGELRRIDPTVTPQAYHCATVSDAELEQLRRVRDVMRLGRVTRIERQRLVLERGTVTTSPATLYIDCTATGIPRVPAKPVFEKDRITLQYVRQCQPAFSAALIGRAEACFEDDVQKNRICRPIPAPDVPSDWLRMMSVELANRYTWSKCPEVREWIEQTRLDSFSKQVQSLSTTDASVISQLERYRRHVAAATANAERLLAT